MQNLDHKISLGEPIFISCQGEGRSVFTFQTFIRLAGCNHIEDGHPCSWKNSNGELSMCDTLYAGHASQGTLMSIPEIEDKVKSLECDHVFITGGEPLLNPYIKDLIFSLFINGHKIEVQTNGSLPLWKTQLNTWSMDCKMPSSGNSKYFLVKNLKCLTKKDQIKCIIADKNDYDYAIKLVCSHNIKARVFFQPAFGILNPKELISWILTDRLQNYISPSVQVQKWIWGTNVRGV